MPGFNFASRILGYRVLDKGGILDDYVNAIEEAYSNRMCYTMPSGEDPGDDKQAWPLQSDLEDYNDEIEDYL